MFYSLDKADIEGSTPADAAWLFQLNPLSQGANLVG
jgi:hypothetical protein